MWDLARRLGWPPGWAFDGQKNIYASDMFLPQHPTDYEVELEEEGRTKPRRLRVDIKWVATVDVGALCRQALQPGNLWW